MIEQKSIMSWRHTRSDAKQPIKIQINVTAVTSGVRPPTQKAFPLARAVPVGTGMELIRSRMSVDGGACAGLSPGVFGVRRPRGARLTAALSKGGGTTQGGAQKAGGILPKPTETAAIEPDCVIRNATHPATNAVNGP